MNVSIWKNFGAMNSAVVFDAFAEGVIKNNHSVSYNNIDADIHVIWSVLWNGRMAGNKKIWDYCIKNKKPVIVLEVGAIKRNITWKMGLNGINRNASWVPVYEQDRPKKLGLNLNPWKTEGKYILICGQNSKSEQWANMPPMEVWMKRCITQIRKYTKRPIVLRPHPRSPITDISSSFENVFFNTPKKINGSYDDYDFNLDDVFLVISHNSNPGVQAIINGVQTLSHTSSLAYPMSIKKIDNILQNFLPDRTDWLNVISHTEFTLTELESGIPYKNLTTKLHCGNISS